MAATAPLSAAVPPVDRPRVAFVGAAVGCAAVAMFFVAAIGVYLRIRGLAIADGGMWLPEGVKLPLPQSSMIGLTLMMSAATAQWAHTAVLSGDRAHSYLALGLTLLFGFAAINQTAYLMSISGLVVREHYQAGLVFGIVGAHLALLLAAMLAMVLVGIRTLGGQFRRGQTDGLASAVLLWHTQVIVYAVIWYAVYITR